MSKATAQINNQCEIAKILIVEDEVVIGLDLQSKLQALGYAVPPVIHYGEQVEEAVIKETPDLILMDINLKGAMRGTEAARLANSRYSIPVVFLTAFSDEQSLSGAKQANPYGYLKKPVSTESLKVTLEIALYKAGMEKKLQQSEENYRRIYENSVAGIYRSTPDGRFIMTNQAFAEMIGFHSPREVIESTTDIATQLYVQADDRQKFIQQIERQGKVTNFEFKFRHANGSERWLSISCHAVYEASDQLFYYEGVAVDITARKEMEAALQQTQQNMKNFFDTNIDFLWVLNEQAEIIAVNETVRRRLEYQDDELAGQSVLAVHPPDRRDEAARIVQDMLAGTREYCPVPLMTRGGVQIPVETYVFSGQWDGQPAIFGVSKDISKLKLSEEKFSSAFHNSPAIIGLSDLDNGEYIEVNQAFYDLLGFSPGEVIGKRAIDLHILSPQSREEMVQKLRDKGSLHNHEVVLQTKENKQLNGLLSAEILSIQGRNYNFTTIIDITQRKQMELVLQKNEKFLNDVLDSVQDGINILDRDLRIVKVNKLLEQQYADRMPLVGKKCYEAFQQRSSICPRCPSMKAMETGEIHHLELEVPHPDGKPQRGWIELYAYPLWENGEVTGVIEYGRNITERKQAELELQNNYIQLKEILNSIDANVYVADLETYEILFMNQRMIDEYGEDMTGRACWESLRHESGPCSDCPNDKLLNAQGEPDGSYSWEYAHLETGKQLILNDRAIRWIDGRMAHLQVGTDITKFKQMEHKLQQKFKMEALGVLAGGVAHNFNNNLAIILGNIEMAQIKKTDLDAVNNYLNTAKTAIFRSRDLVQQILTYSRQGFHDMAPVQIKAVVEETLKLLSATLPSSINLQLIKAAGFAGATIMADSSRIQEALLNLCNNAVQAMDDRGELTITLATVTLTPEELPDQYETPPGGHYVRVSVRDSGCGIDQGTLDKIFDPFFTTKGVGQGTGMGLATVKGIVELHSGFLKVHSRPEEGSVFELYFPAIEQEEQVNIPGFGELPRGTENILFIDDDEILADIWKQILGEQGYSVIAMSSSQDALKLFSADPDYFDLVITDQTMPGLTGMELIARVKQIRPDLPTILCTGYSARITEEKARELGISSFLLKPLDLPDLARTIRAVLHTDMKSE